MSIQDKPRKIIVSVSEMVEMVGLSKSRFYALIQSGVFPKPIREQSCKRPVYDLNLQNKCLEIRATGIGLNGQPVLFNRKSKRAVTKAKAAAQTEGASELMEALSSLGLQVSAGQVGVAITTVFPDGVNGVEPGEVIRKLFLRIKRQNSTDKVGR